MPEGEQPPRRTQPEPEGKQPPGKATGRYREALESLTEVGQHQDRVITALEETLGDLQRWDNYRRFSWQLAGLERLIARSHDTEEIRHGP